MLAGMSMFQLQVEEELCDLYISSMISIQEGLNFIQRLHLIQFFHGR